MKRGIYNSIIGAAGTFGTFSLAKANEVLGFLCGAATLAYMCLKFYSKLQKVRRENFESEQRKQQPELDLDTDL